MSRVHKIVQADPWIGEDLQPEDLLALAIDKGFNHLCQKKGHLFAKEVESSNYLIASPESYLEFPVSTILSPTHLNKAAERALISDEFKFDSSNEKQVVLENVVKALQSKSFPQTIVDSVVAAADEFFTNAIYNAPFVDLKTHKNPGLNRKNTEIRLSGGKFARLFLAHDEGRLVLGCEDPFGSLNLLNYLKSIKATYTRGPAATMNFGPGGAGIGSYIIFNAGASLYFGVWPGRATILCCVVPLGMSNRQRIQMPKHLHWIQR